MLDDPADVAAQRIAVQVLDPREIEPLDQLGVDLPLQLVVSSWRCRRKAVPEDRQPDVGDRDPMLLTLLSFESPCCRRDIDVSSRAVTLIAIVNR